MDIPDALSPGQYAIYALIDPTDELVYYVGQTRSPKGRLAAHLAERHHDGKKGEWLRRLKHKGQQPLMLVLEVVRGEETVLAREQEWIQHFLEEKMPLLNAQAEPTPANQEVLIPLRQETILLFGYPVIVVQLPDERIAVCLGSLCDMLKIARNMQARRIRSDKFLSEQLSCVRIQTAGGPQISAVLTDWAVPIWASGLQTALLSEEKQALALRVKREAASAIEQALIRS